jgi:hypothetical protein
VHGRTFPNPATVALVGAALCAALGGCPGDSAAPTLASATGRYESGQYQLALNEGESVAARGPTADRPQAELIAGMAAFQLERFDAAERHFLAAERSGSAAVRGRARVMLANIRLEQGRASDAAQLFESGASDLSGADAEKARRYAALARDGQLGNALSRGEPDPGRPAAVASAPVTSTPAPAKAPSPTATPAATTATVTPTAKAAAAAAIPPRPAAPAPAAEAPAAEAPAARDRAPVAATSGLFTVRAGAYTTEAAARRRIKALEPDIRRAKVPEPRVEPVATKEGDTLYAVRIGTYKSRAEAESVLKRLARKDLAVGGI